MIIRVREIFVDDRVAGCVPLRLVDCGFPNRKIGFVVLAREFKRAPTMTIISRRKNDFVGSAPG